MKRYYPLCLALASGILLSAGWPPLPMPFLLFIAFVPLFLLGEQPLSRIKFLAGCFLTLLIWNIITTWWMWNSTAEGAMSAIVANCLFMSLPWLAYYNVRKRLGVNTALFALVTSWMTFEYIHLNWELSWPWLTLGNGFASVPDMVQWYQFTGTSGGTLWILLVNVLVFRLWLSAQHNRNGKNRQLVVLLLTALVLPLLCSYLVFREESFEATINKSHREILIIQPNIDPYSKFETGTQDAQLNLLVHLSESGLDSNTRLVVWPETAINLPRGIEEDSIRNNFIVRPVWDFLARHPRLKLLSGIEGYRRYTEDPHSPYAFQFPGSPNYWYESFNTAALLDSTGIVLRYHKSKLVPGVESLPSFLKFMAPIFEKFGGTTGGYARQDERTVLVDSASGLKAAPAICYESIYGEFMTGFLRNGANLICVITNDGWWGNTAGHRQHLAYARLRAIESRRWVVRSANTGISAVIDPMGRITERKGWDERGYIKVNIPTRTEMTFYARNGDLLSKLMVVLCIAILGYSGFRYLAAVRKQ
ncbi:apolipoprotein N-acyltransferase [Flavihumibacter petaseus]|uniref:Apolipoprotein N-acyltransferase n=1 Tax=Flavihumibacter petaseus NBRC 106054 TaxID=1220578 RepID=A0A0E9N6Y6_9BACT|nr:apolipoprotein N-acyltransferase [Flavihumibacter petaseus]GAO45589.1 apolipoprotein N-acyltransferase [Flavihumibacter petaseus NBRC 106054]